MSDKTIIRTTCPRDCYDACGIAVVKRADGLVKVLGDPEHPVSRGALCGKCAIAYNGAWLDPKARVTQPLKRVGPKGEGRFEPVELGRGDRRDRARGSRTLSRRHGAETIWHTHYTGTCSLLAGGFPQRFFNRLGASEVDPDTICNAAGHAALQYMYGASDVGFDPRTAKDANCILVWGANPFASAPHQHKHWLKEAQGQGRSSSTRCAIRPPRTPTCICSRSPAAMPRSPSPCCMCWCAKDRIDRAFLARPHRSAGTSSSPSIVRCSPDWAAPITGVPVGKIEEAAHHLWRRPVAALARPGPAAPADRRQRVPRRRAAAGRDRQSRQARRRLPLPQRRSAARASTATTGGAASAPGRAAQGQPHGSGGDAERSRRRRRRSSPGTSTSPPPIPTRRACTGRCATSGCSTSRSIRSRPTPPTSPTSCCRRRASWSSTTWCRPTSTCRCRRR